MIESAARLNNLPPYVFAVVGQKIRQMTIDGIDVIRLDIGSPDKPPPPAVIDTLISASQNPGNHGYSGYQGTPPFRQAVAAYYQRRFGVSLDSDKEVLPLIGSKEGIINLALAYLNPGDVVLVPEIGYPSYTMGAQLTGADIHWMPLSPGNDFLPDLSQIPAEIAEKAKFLWVNYPNNPTGMAVSANDYAHMVAFCQQHNILLVSDNPYVEITYDGFISGSPLQIPGAIETTIEFMSLSKTYNMGGWRLGAAVGNSAVIKKLLQIKSNVDSGHFLAIYEAGVTALQTTSSDWEQERNRVYQQRRDRIMQVLPQIGLINTLLKRLMQERARSADEHAEPLLARLASTAS